MISLYKLNTRCAGPICFPKNSEILGNNFLAIDTALCHYLATTVYTWSIFSNNKKSHILKFELPPVWFYLCESGGS